MGCSTTVTTDREGGPSPDERLAAFAGQVSHDLKNPLAAITMSLEMARDEVEDLDLDDDTLAGLLERSARGAARMQTMIDDLLAYARGGAAPAREPVDLQALAVEVRDRLLDAAPGAEVAVEGLPVVDGDPAQLGTVLRRLVANALTFTRGGEPPRVSVTARRQGGRWRVEVADQGRGIAPEDRERVFEPFTRLDKTIPGTGVGLATSRRIVLAHGGEIGVDEAPGGGCLAWFELDASA